MSMCERWKFTINLDDNDDYRPTHGLLPDGVLYIVWQLERGGNTNHLHVEGYVRFESRKRMDTVKRFLQRPDAHLETCNGNEEQCREYCTKEDTRVAEGEELGQYDKNAGKRGRRSDLEAIAKKVDDGVDIDVIAREFPGDYMRYHAGIEAYKAVTYKPAAQRDVRVLVLWGPTGTGKTHRVMTKFPDCYSVDQGRDPWGAYTGQTTILMDEWTPEAWPITTMNKILDKWKYQLDRRYRNTYAAWTLVVICTNCAPASFYQTEPNQLLFLAFRRRIAESCRYIDKRETDGGPSFDEILEAPANPSLTQPN